MNHDTLSARPLSERLSACVHQALEQVQDTYGNRPLEIYFNRAHLTQDGISIILHTPYPCQSLHAIWTEAICRALYAHQVQAAVEYVLTVPQHRPQEKVEPHKRIKNIIAVASGKGGVGKSTTAINLALALQQQGARVGILDADLYGPSIPTMLGAHEGTHGTEDNKIVPVTAYAIETMSIGFLVKNTDAMIWRGPMATNSLKQIFTETAWSELDYLFVDFPPGTGDIPLTLTQTLPLAGAIIVTTPQDIALADVRRGIEMFHKMGVETIGIVENMSVHICPQCGHSSHLFGKQGGVGIAEEYKLPVLGQVPLAADICTSMDSGQPIVAAESHSKEHIKLQQVYQEMALNFAARLSMRPAVLGHKANSLGVSILNIRKKKK